MNPSPNGEVVEKSYEQKRGNKSVRSARNGTGNLILRVIVEIPTKLSKEQKRELENWDGEIDLKQYDKLRVMRTTSVRFTGKTLIRRNKISSLRGAFFNAVYDVR